MIFHNELSPLWQESIHKPAFSALRKDQEVDVAIVGAGFTGLTTAYLLAKAGKKVAVLEAGRIAEGESGRTTAHLTHVFDTLPHELRRKFDLETAVSVWNGLSFAVSRIEEIVKTEGLACDFARVPGYLFIDDPAQIDELETVERTVREMGYPVQRARPAGLPFATVGMLEFPNQARMHPLKYLAGLATKLAEMGVLLYEDTHVDDISEGSPITVSTVNGEEVRCGQVVIASHVPMNRVTLHTKQAAYRSYVVGLRVPRGAFPDALFWDMRDPYHYMRIQPSRDFDVLIVGGEDHKTGQMKDDRPPFEHLTHYAHRYLRTPGEVLYRWSGQIMEPVDGLPLIGENPGTHGEWVATGYAGDGVTFATLAAFMITERIQGRTTEWDKRLDPSRLALHGVRDFVGENVDFPTCFVRDRLSSSVSEESPAQLKPGEGGIYKLGGRKLAISRLDDGRLQALSPVCTHLGCIVHYNGIERTWDCPCHGSRFAREGGVINGPAVRALEPLPLETAETAESEAPRLSEAPESWATT